MKYTEMFIKYLERQEKSDETIITYKNVLCKLYASENITEDEFINWDLEQFENYIQSLKDRGEQPNTINKKISTFNSFFSYLCTIGIIERNTPKQLGKIKIDKKRIKFLEIDEAKKLLDVVDSVCINHLDKKLAWVKIRDRFLMNLLLSTGLRIFEAEDLKIEDIDLNTGLLIVQNGKGRKYRELLLPSKVVKMYMEWLEERSNLNINEKDLEYVFISQQNRHLTKRQMQNIVTDFAKEAQVNITSHGLRHTFATMLVNEDVDLKDVQVALGHTLESTTEAIYVHATRKNLQNCRDNNPLFR